jgi:hypothetical protein
MVLWGMMALFVLPQFVHATPVNPNWERHDIAPQTSPIYLYVKDIDGDGDLDVASTTNIHPGVYNSEVAWFQNNLSQGLAWEKFVISSSVSADNPVTNVNGIVVADIDGDGHEDVVVATGRIATNIGSVYWFKAPAEIIGQWERFDVETDTKNSYFKIYTMDVDEDGHEDIIVGGGMGAALFLNPGNPDESEVEWTKIFLSEDGPTPGSSLYLDDLNGDGTTDILNTHTGTVEDDPGNASWFNVLLENDTFSLERTMIDPVLPQAFDINCLDVNGDDRKDVLVTIFMQALMFWYEAPETDNDTWTQHLISNNFEGTDLYTGDINGNGETDFIVSGLFQGTLSWFEYDRLSQTWMEHVIDSIPSPGDISLDDLDGDGDLDAVLAGMGSNQMVWYENKINGDNASSPCVLTFLFGENSTSLAPLRSIRDTVKAAVPGGNRLVSLYYACSPVLIRCIKYFTTLAH